MPLVAEHPPTAAAEHHAAEKVGSAALPAGRCGRCPRGSRAWLGGGESSRRTSTSGSTARAWVSVTTPTYRIVTSPLEASAGSDVEAFGDGVVAELFVVTPLRDLRAVSARAPLGSSQGVNHFVLGGGWTG